MRIEIPDHINPNDLIAAITAGAAAMQRIGYHVDPMVADYCYTLRTLRDVLVRESKPSGMSTTCACGAIRAQSVHQLAEGVD